MDKSIFSNKNLQPNNEDLISVLGNTHCLWKIISDFTIEKYPMAVEEWNFSGEKYGWSFRIKDKKRAIVYLLPRAQFFKVAFVFGQKACDAIAQSNISIKIKLELEFAKKYAEGKGIRMDVQDEKIIEDIKKLIEIKLLT